MLHDLLYHYLEEIEAEIKKLEDAYVFNALNNFDLQLLTLVSEPAQPIGNYARSAPTSHMTSHMICLFSFRRKRIARLAFHPERINKATRIKFIQFILSKQ